MEKGMEEWGRFKGLFSTVTSACMVARAVCFKHGASYDLNP